MMDIIQSELSSHQKVAEKTIENLQNHIYTASIIVNETIKNGNKILVFGNGKNALLAQLIFLKEEEDTSCEKRVKVLDINHNAEDKKLFENQVEKLHKVGDLLIGISASGNSVNVLRALSLGRNLGCKTMGLSGYDGGAMNEFCDLNLVVPSDNIYRITEVHLLIGNIITQSIEN